MGISIDAHDDFEDQWEDEAIEQSIEDAEIEADMERQDAEIKMEKHNGRQALSTTLKTALSIRALPTRTPKARSCLERRTLPAANICFTRKICQLPLQRRRKGDGRTGRTGNY
jgi:hypothetical protein